MNFAFITATPLISQSDLYVMARRIEIGAAHMASAWSLGGWPTEPAVIEVCASGRKLPEGWVACVFYDNVADGHGALGDHGWNPVTSLPALRVMMLATSGIFDGDWSACETASHEVLEAMGNPRVDRWELMPGRPIVAGTPGIETPREACDAVQDHYLVNEAKVANFVTPHWFNRELTDPAKAAEFVAAGGKFDWLGRLSRAGEIGPEGYVVLRDKDRRWTENAAASMAARGKPGARDPLSRTERLLAFENGTI